MTREFVVMRGGDLLARVELGAHPDRPGGPTDYVQEPCRLELQPGDSLHFVTTYEPAAPQHDQTPREAPRGEEEFRGEA